MGDKTTNYIFGELSNLWKAMDSTSSAIVKTAKTTSKSVRLLGVAAICADVAILTSANEIRKLKEELSELKEKRE